MKIREFLMDIVENEILKDAKYSVRVELDDGGYNSYIGLTVDVDNFGGTTTRISTIRIFRRTDTVKILENEWQFAWGNICNSYTDYPDIPLKFSSYGKTPDEAEKEAQKYFKKLRALIAKETSGYEIERAKTAEAEREKLKARLAELEATQ